MLSSKVLYLLKIVKNGKSRVMTRNIMHKIFFITVISFKLSYLNGALYLYAILGCFILVF